MVTLERQVAKEVTVTTRREIIIKAIAKTITWAAAAEILGMTDRHLRRCRSRFEEYGVDGLVDRRGGKARRRRVSVACIEQVCRLKKERYPDFSIRHFYEKITEEHGLKLSYTLTRTVLQDAGLVQRAPARGRHRRKRERRPMTGMMLHNDASTHAWIPGVPARDLVVMMDDADGRFLYMKFVEQEGTASTLASIFAVVAEHGRFGELYTDRGSHFCRTPQANQPSVTSGQVSRVCKALGIRQILAHSPQARGRSERAFGTIQQRLPQELRLAGVTHYGPEADRVLERFRRDLNKRFVVQPKSSESAFVPLVGVDLQLICSEQYERVVAADNTVSFEALTLQIPANNRRTHYARCQVVVHRTPTRNLLITYQGTIIARFLPNGRLDTRKEKTAA